MELTLVLSVGLSAALLNKRNLVLQSAGYTMVRAYSLKAALDCFKTFDFDLILLCQSIPTHEKERLTSWIRSTGSHIPVVSISENRVQQDAFADRTVEGDSRTLIAGISQALISAANPAVLSTAFRDRLAVAAALGNRQAQTTADLRPRSGNSKLHSFPLARAG